MSVTNAYFKLILILQRLKSVINIDVIFKFCWKLVCDYSNDRIS